MSPSRQWNPGFRDQLKLFVTSCPPDIPQRFLRAAGGGTGAVAKPMTEHCEPSRDKLKQRICWKHWLVQGKIIETTGKHAFPQQLRVYQFSPATGSAGAHGWRNYGSKHSDQEGAVNPRQLGSYRFCIKLGHPHQQMQIRSPVSIYTWHTTKYSFISVCVHIYIYLCMRWWTQCKTISNFTRDGWSKASTIRVGDSLLSLPHHHIAINMKVWLYAMLCCLMLFYVM